MPTRRFPLSSVRHPQTRSRHQGPQRPARALVWAGLGLLGASLGPMALPAQAAGKAQAAPVDESAPSVEVVQPILIVRRVTPADRARHQREEAERRERARPAVVAWSRASRPVMAPLRAALAEALASLAIAWGPTSRNVAHPVGTAAEAFKARALPAPDPELDRRLRRALDFLKAGAEACQAGQPTVAQLRLYEGQRWLDFAQEVLRRDYGMAELPARGR